MNKPLNEKLVVAISSRALFDLDACHDIFEQDGVQAYAKHQISHEQEILPKGSAFALAEKLLAISDPESRQPLVEIILLSRNSTDTGLRIFNSIQHYQLNIQRAVFTSGVNPYPYISAFSADLFLSANADDVRHALQAGFASATMLTSPAKQQGHHQLRIAFDGDAVLFTDEVEKIYQEKGLAAFAKHEQHHAKNPLPGGPFKGFLKALHTIQCKFAQDQCPIRTALITARSAPAHERVIRTLRAWDIRIDEALFLGGLSKTQFLQAFNADIFFDDQPIHCEASKEHVATGHVPHGVVNEE